MVKNILNHHKYLIAAVLGIVVAGAILLQSTAFTQIVSQTESDPEVVQQAGDNSATIDTSISTSTPAPPTSLKSLPNSKILTGGKQVFQTFNNCGPASLSMALSYEDIHESQATLGNELRPYQNAIGDNDDKSVTLRELAAKASEYGFVVYHRPAGDIELLKHFINNDIPVITRTWLKPNEDIGHYRVVKGFDDTTNELIQDDSLQGANLRYRYSDFLELWQAFNYEFLVLVPEEKQVGAEVILGELVVKEKAWERALELSEEQLLSESSDVYAQFNKVVALYHLGMYQEAIGIYEAVESELPSRMLWYQIEPLQAYYKNGDYDQVLSLSSDILANENRAFSELHYLKGLVFTARGQDTQAFEAFEKAEEYNGTAYWKQNFEI